MTYEDLMEEAKTIYEKTAPNSRLCAIVDARKHIASKIDLCSDRDKHLDVLEWDEYKQYYAPMTRREYKSRKKEARRRLAQELDRIDKEWGSRGINSPNYHKI